MPHRRCTFLAPLLLALSILAGAGIRSAGAQTAAGTDMAKSYAQAHDFLKKHTPVIELTGEANQRVAICPDYQGRIMTSSFAGDRGASLGWINYDFITAGKHDPAFNNYGGEDRFWLGPEGGQYALWFKLEEKQVVKNWFTPSALNTGAFRVISHNATSCRLARRARATNASEYTFDLEVEPQCVWSTSNSSRHRSASWRPMKFARRKLRAFALPYVGFETVNTAKNVGPTAWDTLSGMVSIWTLGQFPSGDQTVIIVPYKPGSDAELGQVVQSDYFGTVPDDRLKVTPSAVLFRADGKFRAKLGTSQKRAPPLRGRDRPAHRRADACPLRDAGKPSRAFLRQQRVEDLAARGLRGGCIQHV